MMKNTKLIILIIISLSLLNSCKSVKEGLTGQKQSNSDEFLVQKKNPLVMPPDYNELPKPKSETETSTQVTESNQDIEKLISILPESTNDSNTELEKFILEKINENNN